MASIAIATNVTNVRSLRTQDNVEYMYTTSSELDVDWIHLWIGLASVGWPFFLFSNRCSPVDAVSFKLLFVNLAIPILSRWKVSIRIDSGLPVRFNTRHLWIWMDWIGLDVRCEHPDGLDPWAPRLDWIGSAKITICELSYKCTQWSIHAFCFFCYLPLCAAVLAEHTNCTTTKLFFIKVSMSNSVSVYIG